MRSFTEQIKCQPLNGVKHQQKEPKNQVMDNRKWIGDYF